ncbi:MAG: hypothetical protein ACO3N7_02615 [Kiritimatiellia bacterium]
MARPYRVKFEHASYLVSLQGVDGLGLFVEDTDAVHFVDLLGLIASKHQVILHAYALADNQAALVIETPKANLSLYLQGVQTAFARHIRQHYVQSGPIMRDRYRAKLLEKSEVLTQACEWVHCFPLLTAENPLSPAAQRKELRTFRFSSLAEILSGQEDLPNRSVEFLRGYGSPVKKRLEKHLQACEQLLTEGGASWKRRSKASPIAIGSADFVKEMEQKHAALVDGKRVKGLRSYGKKVQGISRFKVVEETAEVLGVSKEDFFVQRHHSMLRPVLAGFLYQFAGMTQKEIAAFLRLGSAAAVSLQIKQLLQARQRNPELDKMCRKLEKRFTRN